MFVIMKTSPFRFLQPVGEIESQVKHDSEWREARARAKTLNQVQVWNDLNREGGLGRIGKT